MHKALDEPIRILDLRSVTGMGGGPDRSILQTARLAPQYGMRVTAGYIRWLNDRELGLKEKATSLGIDYREIVQRRRFDPAVLRQAQQLALARDVNLVISHDYKTALLALIIARRLGLRKLAMIHGWSGRHWRERLCYYPMEKILLRHFDSVIAVSSPLKLGAEAWGVNKNRIQVVLNGVDGVRYQRSDGLGENWRRSVGVSRDAVLLGAVGRLAPEKRYDLLIDAVAILRRRHEDVQLFIAGTGPMEQKLTLQIQDLGLQDYCRLLGHQADLAPLYQALDVLVQSSEREGTSNTLLEAMACETPVVATNVGGTAELIEDGVHGWLVVPGSAEAIAAAVEQTLMDRDATIRRAQAARRRVEAELSFDARMRRLQGICSALVNRIIPAEACARIAENRLSGHCEISAAANQS